MSQIDPADGKAVFGPQLPGHQLYQSRLGAFAHAKAHAHDTVLATMPGRATDIPIHELAEIAWAHEVEQMRAKRQAARRRDADGDATDLVLARTGHGR